MIKRCVTILAMAALPTTALAQIGLPGGLPALPRLPTLPTAELPEVPDRVTTVATAQLDRLSPVELGRVLEAARLDRLSRFVASNRREVIADRDGNPAVRGVIIVTGADPATMSAAQKQGFSILDRQEIAGLGMSFARLSPPPRMDEVEAMELARSLMPDAEIGLDHYYLPSGGTARTARAAGPAPVATGKGRVGIVDGGLGRSRRLPHAIQRGFAGGAPRPSNHASAMASLVAGDAPQRAAAPGAELLVADVYGSGPQGGTASAIAQALGWLVQEDVPVAVLSLVGPDNPLLRRAVRAAQGRGTIIVAAVGNDGPAAPPAYPASLPGVLAVTGTGKGNGVIPEAGRALHVDFAAPGADIKAHDASGRLARVRGTSFAAPLVAGRLARYYPRPDIARIEAAVRKLIADARDLGEEGRDPVYGHGLVCGDCGAR